MRAAAGLVAGAAGGLLVDLLATLRARLHKSFGIDHITIQLESAGATGPCTTCR